MLLGGASVEPRAPSPDPSRERRRGGGRQHRTPPSLSLLFLHVADHPALARADPQHSAAETEPLQHASEAAVSLDARAQDPRSDELLDARALDAPAYKRPRRSNGETHPTPSYRPDNLSPSLSLWFVDAYNAGEVLDAKRAAVFDHPGASRHWESEEEHRRSRSRTSPLSSASSTRVAITVVFFTGRR
jgi:hypothetical protein